MLRRIQIPALALVAVIGAVALGSGGSERTGVARHAVAPAALNAAERTFVLGRSVRGRAIRAVELGDPAAPKKLVVVGVVHGNETAGLAVARALMAVAPPADVDLWVVPALNPDGVAAHTRQNARGVDLNRNFAWRWRRTGRRGDPQYPGPRVLSEPESRIARRLIIRVRPQITIWFHQPLRLVDLSGGRVAVERRYAQLIRLPLRRLRRYHGSAASWQNTHLRGSTAFVVELPPGQPRQADVARYADAVLTLTREA